ncbi:MAG: xanthine phosphoribosyltransferase [Oscillospiraceae bacterium]|nr:xanthine phosphoribosyltransferase [Oscillospiraceae bacterium]
MNFLEERIIAEGVVKSGEVLKVDSFLNHQMDMELLDDIAREFKLRFFGKPVTKVLTIETSGIGLACAVAREFDVPMVYARKTASVNLDADAYVAEVDSYGTGKVRQIMVSRKFLKPEDHVLIVDDFLANGCALQGLIALVEDAGASVTGCGVAIEKSFQEGGHRIRNLGYHLESLAIVERLDPETGAITFGTE